MPAYPAVCRSPAWPCPPRLRCMRRPHGSGGRRRARRPTRRTPRGRGDRYQQVDARLVERVRHGDDRPPGPVLQTTRAGKRRTDVAAPWLSPSVTPDTPSTWGIARRSGQQVVGGLAGHVDGGDGRLAAAEDAVLHVLDVQAGGAELVEDLGEYADAVEVADRQGDRPESPRGRGSRSGVPLRSRTRRRSRSRPPRSRVGPARWRRRCGGSRPHWGAGRGVSPRGPFRSAARRRTRRDLRVPRQRPAPRAGRVRRPPLPREVLSRIAPFFIWLEEVLVDEVPGVLAGRNVQGHDVGGGHQLLASSRTS